MRALNSRRVLGIIAPTLFTLACARDWRFLEDPGGSANEGGAAGSTNPRVAASGGQNADSAGGGGMGSGVAGSPENVGGQQNTAGVAGSIVLPTAGSGGNEQEPDEYPHSITVGTGHVCALRSSDGAVLCLGNNFYGQRGNGEARQLSRAEYFVWNEVGEGEQKKQFLGAEDLHGGANYNCARRGTEIWCWGTNQNSEMATPPELMTANTARRIEFPDIRPYSELELYAGEQHVCVNAFEAGYWCWGENRFLQIHGRLAPGELLPTEAYPPGQELERISLGEKFSLGIFGRRQTVQCWGLDDLGQCGNLESKVKCSTRSKPACVPERQTVPGVGPAYEVFAGHQHACAVTLDHEIVCWGMNHSGQVSPSSTCKPDTQCITPATKVPNVVLSTQGPLRLALGAGHTCALTDGKVTCWGWDESLGTGSTAALPAQMGGSVVREDGTQLTDVVDIDASNAFTCAITRTDEVYCWGYFAGEEALWSRAHRLAF